MRGGLRTLLASLLVFILLFPVLDEGVLGRAIGVIVSTVIALAGAYAASRDRRRLATALLLAMPAVGARWAFVFIGTPVVHGVALATSIVFYTYTLLLILGYVLRTDQVTVDEICGAVCVYVLIGFVWGMAFGLVELKNPGSLHSASGELGPGDFIYFSFATLMTVGYGDMYPVAPAARSLALVEALVGVIFIAVLIGRLVGLHAATGRHT
jgi:hypothetical protein